MSPTARSVAHRFSTSSLPQRERVSRWREEFARGPVQVDLEPLYLEGSAATSQFDRDVTLTPGDAICTRE